MGILLTYSGCFVVRTDYEGEDFYITLKKGILFCEFRNKSTLAGVLAAENAAIELLEENDLKVVPFVLTMKNIDQSKTDIGMLNLSKVITSNKILDYISSMWVVGAKRQIRTIAKLINNTFFDDKINFSETIEEATREAEKFKNKKSPILDFNA